MRGSRIFLGGSLLLAVAAIGTYGAGEQVEVVTLRTFDADGAPHDTKLWVVDHDGVPWVRVANPQRQWFLRLRADPRAELLRDGQTQPVHARPEATRVAREALNRSFREKYGVVDWWYGVLLRRGAVPVRLDPALDVSRPRSGDSRRASFYEQLGNRNDGVSTMETRGGAVVQSRRYVWWRAERLWNGSVPARSTA